MVFPFVECVRILLGPCANSCTLTNVLFGYILPSDVWGIFSWRRDNKHGAERAGYTAPTGIPFPEFDGPEYN
jgi:hypothetical protein